MAKAEKKRTVLLFLFLSAILSVSVLSMLFFGDMYVSSKRLSTNEPTVFDLSEVSLDSGEHAYLPGEWEYYGNRLLITDGLRGAKPDSIVKITGVNSLLQVSYPHGSCASYRGVLRNVSAKEALTVYVPNLTGAYRIYIDGRLVTESGSLSHRPSEVWSSVYATQTPFWLSDAGEHEIVIETSYRFFGGLYLNPLLISYSYNGILTDMIMATRFFEIGIVFFCALLFSIIRIFFKSRHNPFWLTVFCGLLCFRMFATAEGYRVAQPFFFMLSYEYINILIYISTFAIKISALLYFKSAFAESFKLTKKKIIVILILVPSVFVAFGFGGFLIDYPYLPLETVSILIDFYILFRLSVHIVRKKPYAKIYTFIFTCLFSGLTVDNLYGRGLIPFDCSAYMPVCFLIFVIGIAFISAMELSSHYYMSLRNESLQRQLTEANAALMVSQIQPHFLYNALNTIKYLIRKNPQTAERAVIDFSYYLRGNMDSLSQKEPIPFASELDHIKHYCSIELLRFPDTLNIFYDIEDDNFFVPALSVQPIVENAIKHGVTKKPEGGSVTISAYSDEQFHYIKVEDDGLGFDPQNTVYTDGRSHIGLENIRKRFHSVLNAEVLIKSIPGAGTTVTVKIPKREEPTS